MTTSRKFEFALVIPVFNEENRLIASEIEESFKDFYGVKIIFVNDGSTDATSTILNNLAEKFTGNPIDILENQANLGKAESIRRGFLTALSYNCNYIGFTDGDFATPPHEIKRLIEVIRETRPLALFGVRRNENGNDVETTWYRKMQGIIFNFLAKKLVRADLQDPQCGTKFFMNSSNLKQAVSTEFLNPWLFDLEIYLRMKYQLGSFEVDEITLSSWKHQPNSKIRIKDPLLMLINLRKLRRIYLEAK